MPIFYIAWTLLCFLFLQFCFPYVFFYKEQMQLFLFSSNYICSYFDHPAWLASLSGDFLTQFFYLIGGGAIVVSTVLLITMLMANDVLKQIWNAKISFVISLLLVVYELLCNVSVVYPLSATMSLLGSFVLLWLAFKVKNKYRFLVYLIILTLAYWMFGYSYVVVLILLIIKEIKSYVWILAYTITFLILPFIFRPLYLTTVRQSFLLPKPFLMPYVDTEQDKWIGLSVETYFGHWQKVLDLTRQINDNSQYITYFYNLAEAKKMNLSDSLMMFYQPMNEGLFLPIGSDKSVMWIQSSADVWYEIGDMTMAEHATMLGQIFSKNRRSVRAVRRLAEINLINDDTVAVQKYLRMLGKTMFHRTWASMRNPYSLQPNVAKWLERKRKNSVKEDVIRGNDYLTSLYKLLDANRDNQMALDYLLCDHLLSKNISAFYSDYVRYAKDRQPSRIYVEALLIYMAVKNVPQEEAAQFRIPKEVYNEFMDYTTHYEKGDVETLKAKYAKTYWAYFHFMVNKEK